MKKVTNRCNELSLKDMCKESNGVRWNIIVEEVSILQGKILTIIDAVYSTPEQNKAVKDLIKDAFWKNLDGFRDLCFKDGMMMSENYANSLIKSDALILTREQAEKMGLDVDKIEAEAKK